jgi:hypothetical protein
VASDWYRFSKIKDTFAVYTELLNYEPMKYVIEYLKKFRPPMEAEIASELFKFIRNVAGPDSGLSTELIYCMIYRKEFVSFRRIIINLIYQLSTI